MSIDTSEGHAAMDYNEHLRTFAGFVLATKIMVVSIVVILLFMLFTLV